MAIKDIPELEQKLSEVCRYYRALYEMYSTVHASDAQETTQWVLVGGGIMEKLDAAVSDIEAYAGAVDLRLILRDLREMREQKSGIADRGEQ